MSLLSQVVTILESRGIPHALTGAAAMAIHGVVRSTADQDLFVMDRACLDRQPWSALEERGIQVTVRRGDATDPLAGVVRFRMPGELPLDLVVGKLRWQRTALERATRSSYGELTLPVLRAADLILLKLYAGGPQDAWDIQQLLEGEERDDLIAEVERHLPELSSDCEPPEVARPPGPCEPGLARSLRAGPLKQSSAGWAAELVTGISARARSRSQRQAAAGVERGAGQPRTAGGERSCPAWALSRVGHRAIGPSRGGRRHSGCLESLAQVGE